MIKHDFMFSTEIKNRLTIVLLNYVLNFVVLFLNKENLLFFVTNKVSGLGFPSSYMYLIFTNPSEILVLYFEIVIFFTSIVGTLLVFYNLASFFSPALSNSSLVSAKTFCHLFFFIYVITFFFFNFCLLPQIFKILIDLSENSDPSPLSLFFEPSALNFLGFYKDFYFTVLSVCGLSFFFFFFSLSYIRANITIAKVGRRFVYCAISLLSALFLSSDLVAQLSVFLFCMFLVEMSLYFSIALEKTSLTRKPIKAC